MLIIDDSWFKIEMQEDIHECYIEIYNKYKVPRATRYPESHVFDDEKSVRWNREEVARQNQLIKDEIATAVAERATVLNRLDEAVVRYITENFYLSNIIAKKVVEAAKSYHYDDWWDYIDDIAGFAEDIINTWKENKND